MASEERLEGVPLLREALAELPERLAPWRTESAELIPVPVVACAADPMSTSSGPWRAPDREAFLHEQHRKFDKGRPKLPWLERKDGLYQLTLARVGELNREPTELDDMDAHVYRVASADALIQAVGERQRSATAGVFQLVEISAALGRVAALISEPERRRRFDKHAATAHAEVSALLEGLRREALREHREQVIRPVPLHASQASRSFARAWARLPPRIRGGELQALWDSPPLALARSELLTLARKRGAAGECQGSCRV